MTDELITFETAKLAKEKGYDENSQRYFEIYRGKPNCLHTNASVNNNRWRDKGFENLWVCCTQGLLARWLREKHNLNIGMVYFNVPNYPYWEYRVHYKERYGNADTYEKSLEIALQEALKLITGL